jgi:UDP-2-acetamido-3-amino-2,3-dideoxy-glucuronate N-acetyltransferase
MPDLTKPSPRIAAVGCGFWGRNIVRNFAGLGALAALCDTDAAAAAALGKTYGVAVRPLGDILADPDIDALAIASPAVTHAEIAIVALQAGKHVFIEKPMALDIADAENMVRMAAERDRTLMVGHLLQYHPAFVALRNLQAEGRLGHLRYLYSNRLNLGRVRREENILWSFAPHDISMILTLVGEEPDTVTTIGHSYLQQSVADTTTTHLSFPGGTDAHVYVSWLHPFKEQKLVAIGGMGMAVFDDTLDWREKLVVYPHRVDITDQVPIAVRAEAEAIALPENEPLAVECRHFIECIQSGKPPRTDGAEGLRVLRVLYAAEQQLRNQNP